VTTERAVRAAEMVGQAYSWQKAAAGYLSVFQEVVEGSITRVGGR